MTCIDLTSKRSKMLSYVAKHSKQRKTTKQNKLQLIASIVCQNDRNKAKLQKWSKSNDLNRFDVKTFKTKQIYKTDQITMNCIDWMSKHSKQSKTTKPIKLQWIASIGCQNDRNKAKLQKWSKSNDLHRFHVKTIKNVELRRKTFKTTLNYKSDQNPMTCIDLTSKRSKMLSYVAKHSKQRKTTKPIKLQWIASFGCQKVRNKAKLQKWSKSNDLHRFDVKTIKNVELRRKTFKTTLNYKSDQNPINWIDLMSKHSKQSKTIKPIKLQWIASIGCQNVRNKAKLQKWSKSNDLHRFDVKPIKNVDLRRKTFKTTQNNKTEQTTINCIDWMSKRSKQS